MNYDKQSFLAGVSVGMKLKGVTGGHGSEGGGTPGKVDKFRSSVVIPVDFTIVSDEAQAEEG